jgi:chorismate lyase / 3-hydroxybenzoate synthase
MARLQLDYLPLRNLRASEDLLGVIAFDATHPLATLTLPIAQLGPEPLVEVWRGDGARLVTASSDEACLECGTRRAYEQLFRAAGDFHLIRIWNHIAGLNDGDGDAERYRRFCIGRHEAFAAAGWSKERFPSASGVGMRGGALAVYALAARDEGTQIENPRQVSAYDYPRTYGPRSPSFARATVAAGLLLTAGTSSVVGHRTAHADDVAAQLDETLVNLDALARSAGAAGLGVFDRLKIYLRRRDDYALVAARLARELPRAQTLFLESDICRGDLLVEIEAVGALRP